VPLPSSSDYLYILPFLPCWLVAPPPPPPPLRSCEKSQVSKLLVVGVHGRSSTTELLNTIGIPYCQIIAAQEPYYHCGWRLLSEASTCMKPSRDQVRALKREILPTAIDFKEKPTSFLELSLRRIKNNELYLCLYRKFNSWMLVWMDSQIEKKNDPSPNYI
jgi:hypothetical protein